MKKSLLATVALSALIAAPAMAADLAVKAPLYKAPPPVYVYSWTGCYIGGNIGGLWATKDWTNVTPGAAFGRPISSQDASSFLGGFQGGCNYQVGSWVFGIQGDYDWTDANGSAADQIAIGFTDRVRIRSLASVTGRVGYAWD